MSPTLSARFRAGATVPSFAQPGTPANRLSLAPTDLSSAARCLAIRFDHGSHRAGSSLYDNIGALDEVASS